MRKNPIFVALFVLVSIAAVVAQDAAKPERAKSEEAIRSAGYLSTLFALTADVKSYKQHAARRMIGLYELMYQELAKDAETRRVLRQNGIESADDFMASRLRRAASRFAGLSRPQIEELARREAAAPITHINDKEAKIGGVRVVLEDGLWKTDASEAIKAGLLRDPDGRLSAESRAKIERF